MEKSEKYTLWIIEQVVIHLEDGGTRDNVPNIRWSRLDQILMMRIVQIEWGAPPEKPVKLADFQAFHGVKWEQVIADNKHTIRGDMVVLHELRIWTKRTKIIQQAVHQQTQALDDPWSAAHASDIVAGAVRSMNAGGLNGFDKFNEGAAEVMSLDMDMLASTSASVPPTTPSKATASSGSSTTPQASLPSQALSSPQA